MKKLIKKIKKLIEKIMKYEQILNWNAFSGSAKHCGIIFQGLHFNIASNKNHFYKKSNYTQIKWAT